MRKVLFSFFIFLIWSISIMGQVKQMVEMPAIFSDNMVLQQKSKVPFWGHANPNQTINIKSTWGAESKTISDAGGNWKTVLKTKSAGGPYEVTLKIGDSSIIFKNVMIGEVWICSGQSNMEMPLAGWPPRDTIANSMNEIQSANYPMIRMFSVTKAISAKPVFNCIGTWKVCTPDVAAKFSATAYFFGKKLFQELKVPVGLILTAWGGTPVETWIGGKYIIQNEAYTDYLPKLEKGEAELENYLQWLTPHKTIDVSKRKEEEKWKSLDFGDFSCAEKVLNDSLWAKMKIPVLWEKTEVGTFDGVVWFRKQVEIPKSWLNKDLVLDLGPIDDYDITFVNGKRIGGYESGAAYQINRIFDVPAGIIIDSIVTIAVRVTDIMGGGGIYGKEEQINIRVKNTEEKINLAGGWKYLPVAELKNDKFYLLDFSENEFLKRPPVTLQISQNSPTTLYNAMIAPLIPYSIKGAIWYQGESNTGKPEAYKTLFPLMIKNWREDWQKDFSFLFVQIAPWRYGKDTYSQKLRESQLFTLKVPKTGMAVTLDIGDSVTIHPANKKDAGERLSLWALAKDYGKKIPFSGPLYKSFKIIGDKVNLFFDYAEGLKIKEKGNKTNFQIAGGDSVFQDANVKVKGNTLIVYSNGIKNPSAVRYGWNNITEATLFNKSGLPASSFRTDDWEK